MKIPFTKMSGAGNDFVVVDNRAGIISDPHKFTVSVCDRRLGIGADGVLLIEKSTNADFLMQYYNSDGTNAGMCGNGGRCIAKFAYDKSIVTSDSFKFEAFGYVYDTLRSDSTTYQLKMKVSAHYVPNQMIKLKDRTIKGNYLNTGTDHSIIFIDENPEIGSIEKADVFNLGREIRYHETYQPKGTNVNFVSKIDSKAIRIRTYERGVEDETLACGTGSVASALLSSIKFGMRSPINVIVQSGKSLEIGFVRNNNDSFQEITLKGSAETIFEGSININNNCELIPE